jgi:hypothetical protein
VVLENKVCYHNYTTPANERGPGEPGRPSHHRHIHPVSSPLFPSFSGWKAKWILSFPPKITVGRSSCRNFVGRQRPENLLLVRAGGQGIGNARGSSLCEENAVDRRH